MNRCNVIQNWIHNVDVQAAYYIRLLDLFTFCSFVPTSLFFLAFWLHFSLCLCLSLHLSLSLSLSIGLLSYTVFHPLCPFLIVLAFCSEFCCCRLSFVGCDFEEFSWWLWGQRSLVSQAGPSHVFLIFCLQFLDMLTSIEHTVKPLLLVLFYSGTSTMTILMNWIHFNSVQE